MPDKVTGLYVTAERITRGLVVTLTDAGREELNNMTESDPDNECEYPGALRFDRSYVSAWRALILDLEECQDIHMLTDSEYEMVGALTSAPIIVALPKFDAETNDLTAFDAVFWFPNYQIESELETLLRTGTVTFDLASDPQDLMTCECGFETYVVERMHAHKCGKDGQ